MHFIDLLYYIDTDLNTLNNLRSFNIHPILTPAPGPATQVINTVTQNVFVELSISIQYRYIKNMKQKLINISVVLGVQTIAGSLAKEATR